MPGAQAMLSLPTTAVSPVDLIGSRLEGNKTRAVGEMAKDFEAMFVSLLLKEMRQTLDNGGLFPGDSSDVQGGLFDLFMSKHIADAGSMGMAAAIQQQMTLPPGAIDAHRLPADRGSMPQAPRS